MRGRVEERGDSSAGYFFTNTMQCCPMAFDNAGADWLSDEEQVRNPYFGDLMMKCGYVKEIL